MASDILSHTVLTSLIQEMVPVANLGASLFEGQLPATSDSFQFDVITGTRTPPAHRNPRGAAGNQAEMAKETVTSPLVTIREKKALHGADIKWTRQPGTEHQRYGEKKILDELQDLRNIIGIAQEMLRWTVLRTGIATGTVDGVAFSVDFRRSLTGHFGLSPAGDDWDGTSPAIINDVTLWSSLLEQDCGMPARKAFCTKHTMKLMMQDSAVSALLSENQKDQFMREGRITQFQNIDWYTYDAGYVNSAGAFVPFINGVTGTADQFVVFTTDGFVGEERSCAAPDDEAGDMIGLFSKAYADKDPAVTWILAHLTSMPGLTKPRNVVCAQVAT